MTELVQTVESLFDGHFHADLPAMGPLIPLGAPFGYLAVIFGLQAIMRGRFAWLLGCLVAWLLGCLVAWLLGCAMPALSPGDGCLSVCLVWSVCLSVCDVCDVCLSVCLSVMSVMSVCLSVCVSVCL